MSSFCSAKATHIFSAKNIRILYFESAKTVNEMTLNELVKLTTLWTTGPWTLVFYFLNLLVWPKCRFLWGAGWSGGAKVLCILHHWGVQLILAYSWARPAILVVGKGRGGMFLFLLFLHFHSCSSFFPVPLFHLLYSLFYLFSPFLWETTQNDPQGLTCR